MALTRHKKKKKNLIKACMIGLKVLKKQSISFQVILVVPNQIVLDPFMGSGTITGIAALKLKCQFIGIELDETKFQIASARLHDYYYYYHHQQEYFTIGNFNCLFYSLFFPTDFER
jgi:hypothetical protein